MTVKSRKEVEKGIFKNVRAIVFERKQELEFLREFFFSLHVHCNRYKGKADSRVVTTAMELIVLGRAGEKPRHIFHDLADIVKDFLAAWNYKSGGQCRLHLTPQWLHAWFLVRLCTPETDPQKQKFSPVYAYLYPGQAPSPYSPEETLAFLNKLATLGLYVIHWIKNSYQKAEAAQKAEAENQERPEPRKHPERFAEVEGGEKALLKALLYLIAEYAHIKGELTRKAELSHTLEQIWSNEAVLYTIRDTYRDHINHMVETCLLGLLLIDLKNEHDGYYFAQLLELFEKKNEHQLLRNWILAALLHDTGYALEICRQAGAPLKFMAAADQVKGFSEGFNGWFAKNEQETCQKIRERLGKVERCEWLNDNTDLNLKEFDHGVVSAYFTLYLIKDRGQPEKRWREDIPQALNTMARHNLKRYPTSCTEDTLAFLLILCDHLQEWDRPIVDAMEMRHTLVVHLLGKAWAGLEPDGLVKYLEVKNVRYNPENNAIQLESGGPLGFALHYREAGRERYHPPPTWVGITYDFQSLSQCPWDISIELLHPVTEDRVPEMELFKAFLREHPELAILRDWAIKSSPVAKDPHDDEGWFEYRQEHEKEGTNGGGNKGTGYEIFTLHLNKIHGDPIIIDIPKGYTGKYLDFYKERYPYR